MMVVEPMTQWRGQPDTRRWRFYGLVGLSMVLHSALTPLAALLGLLGWLGLSTPPETQDLPPITAIPIDLIEDEPVADSSDPEPKEEPASTLVAEPAPEPTPPEPEGLATPPQPPAADESGKGEDEEHKDIAEEEKMGDPVALSGSAGKLADSGANVRIKIDTDKVRKHPLGARIGEVLGRVPQWYDFLGPAKLDPIRDIDRLLIAGPQLRDSSEVVAVLQYNVEQSAMESAIDQLVQRSGGEWIDGPTKAATARADRAERVFAFFAPGLLAIVPPSAKKDALKAWPKRTRLGAIPGDAVLVATIETPHRVYTGLPFRFPETFKWVRASVTPDAKGGAVARIEAQDESDDLAKEHAEWLERSTIAVTSPKGFAAAAAKFLYGGSKFLDEVHFHSEGDRVLGTLTITDAQLNILLSMVEGIINSWNPKPAPTASSTPSASATPAPSASGLPGASATSLAPELQAPSPMAPPRSSLPPRPSAPAPEVRPPPSASPE